jgi:hypothetical protein
MSVPCTIREHSVEEWVQIVRAEYGESLGLSLTRLQVRRLWGIDDAVCEAVLAHLMMTGFLRQNRRGRFVRNE